MYVHVNEARHTAPRAAGSLQRHSEQKRVSCSRTEPLIGRHRASLWGNRQAEAYITLGRALCTELSPKYATIANTVTQIFPRKGGFSCSDYI